MSNTENDVKKQATGATVGGILGGGAGWLLGSVGVAGLTGVGVAFSLPLLLPGLVVGGLAGALVAANAKNKKDK